MPRLQRAVQRLHQRKHVHRLPEPRSRDSERRLPGCVQPGLCRGRQQDLPACVACRRASVCQHRSLTRAFSRNPACPFPCSTCNALSSNDCASCESPRLLHQGACVLTCPAGTFASGLLCQTCSSDCKTCAGSAANCTSCRDETRVLFDNACVGACPDGMYADANHVCQRTHAAAAARDAPCSRPRVGRMLEPVQDLRGHE